MKCTKILKQAKHRYNRINYDINLFCGKISLIARELHIPEKWLMAAISIETAGTFDHRIKNSNTNAYGLFQCMPATCSHLTSRGILEYPSQIKYMDALQQLDVLKQYLQLRLKEQGFKNYYSFTHLYLAIFYPSAMKYYNQPNRVVGTRITAQMNPAFDLNHDGIITIGEIQQYYKQHFNEGVDKKIIIAAIVGLIKTFK